MDQIFMPDFQFVTIENIRIRYIDKNQKGFPLLLIHGLGGSIESWLNNIDSLAAKFRIIALDLPGFGLSDKPKISYTIRFYVNFVEKFIKKLKINHVYLIGASLGGHIAVEFTLNNKRIVDKLVLISPAGSLPKSFKGTPATKKIYQDNSSQIFKRCKQNINFN